MDVVFITGNTATLQKILLSCFRVVVGGGGAGVLQRLSFHSHVLIKLIKLLRKCFL